jgi:hypothetical protein
MHGGSVSVSEFQTAFAVNWRNHRWHALWYRWISKLAMKVELAGKRLTFANSGIS